MPILIVAGFGITVLIVFLKNLRSELARSIPWKRLALGSLWGFAGYVLALAFGDYIQATLNAYTTAVPLTTRLGAGVIFALLRPLFSFGFLALLFDAAGYS